MDSLEQLFYSQLKNLDDSFAGNYSEWTTLPTNELNAVMESFYRFQENHKEEGNISSFGVGDFLLSYDKMRGYARLKINSNRKEVSITYYLMKDSGKPESIEGVGDFSIVLGAREEVNLTLKCKNRSVTERFNRIAWKQLQSVLLEQPITILPMEQFYDNLPRPR